MNKIVERILENGDVELSAKEVVERALDELSVSSLTPETQSALDDFAEAQFASDADSSEDGQTPRERVVNILKIVGATPEFQRA